MDMKKTLLEKCEEIIENTYWPFVKSNLKTKKVFNDLLQYHDSTIVGKTLLNAQSVDDSVMSQSSHQNKFINVPHHMRKASYGPGGGKHTATSGISAGLTGYTNNSSHKF